jgi:hypothetical protein
MPYASQVALKKAESKDPFGYNQRKREGSDRGVSVHDWVASYLGGSLPPLLPLTLQGYKYHLLPFLDQLLHNSTSVFPEMVVFGENFAGTLDIAALGNGIALYDVKTKDAPIHPDSLHEAFVQLGGYCDGFEQTYGFKVSSLNVVVAYPRSCLIKTQMPDEWLRRWRYRLEAYQRE